MARKQIEAASLCRVATCFCEKLWKRSRRRLLGRRSLQTGEEELGGNQLSWSLKHGVIFCLFFAAKSLQETSMRRMLWSNHHHSGPVFFDRYIFQCCIWYMSNLQHVNEILFLQPRNPYITLKPTLIMFVGFCAALYEHLFCAFSLNSNSGVVLQSSVIWFSANNSPLSNLWFLIDLLGT